MSASTRCARCSRGIGAGEIRELLVFNKIDLSRRRSAEHRAGSTGWRRKCGRPRRTARVLMILRDSLARAVRPNQVRRTFHLQLQAAAVRSESVPSAMPCAPSGNARMAVGRWTSSSIWPRLPNCRAPRCVLLEPERPRCAARRLSYGACLIECPTAHRFHNRHTHGLERTWRRKTRSLEPTRNSRKTIWMRCCEISSAA